MRIRIRPFELADTDAVVALWQDAGLTRPWNDPHEDIRRKPAVQPELFLVAVDDAEAKDTGTEGLAVVGAVMAGYDGHRGWLHDLASASNRRGEGIGRLLVVAAEERLRALGCPKAQLMVQLKAQLMVRPENHGVRGFSAVLGYEPFDTWATGKRLIAD
ncbi:MAG: GNAT family acetyltransferase [Microbacterium sp.]